MRRRATAVLALAVVLAFPACRNEVGPGETPFLNGDEVRTPTPQATPHGGPILAIGDSLLRGAEQAGSFGAILEFDGWEPEMIAESGRSTRWAVDEIEARDERVPRYVVVVLGTNPGFSSDGFADEVKELRDALVRKGARRILWMPPHHPESDRYAEKIRILTEADRIDRRLVVPLGWGAVLDAHPEWVVSDGVHLTEDGYAVMAVYIRDQLAKLG